MKLSNIEVKYIDHMGTDLTVVNAARVSFNKESSVIDTKDERLIKYLSEHNHWSPFAHTAIQFRIKAPIFVARQLVKHQVGGVWNEISRRYVDYEPEFYVPDSWRSTPINKKQGSGTDIIENIDISNFLNTSIDLYNELLAKNVAPEQARMILPLNSMTEWYWTGSLIFWNRVCRLRMESSSQEETREVATKISEIILPLFPISWNSLFS